MNADPIELELLRNLFEAAAEEMGITLQRTSFSANIKERRDFSCAIFDANAILLAQAAHIPVHLGSMGESVRAAIDALGTLHAGDVAILNDPFAGGTHLPDITIISPVYVRDRLVAFAANRAHHADVGGISPGSMTLSRSIDQEGVRIEPALLYRQGVRDEQVLARLLDATRTPDERLGDLDAQLAANRVGEAALHRMIDRHGADHVLLYGRALLDYSQSFMSRAIRSIPSGIYEFSDAMDDDGAGSAPIALHTRVEIADDRAIVDLRNCADQVNGCINCPRAVAMAAVWYCFACLMHDLSDDPPLNGGSFRNIDLLTRPGSVVHAIYPAAVVAGNTETSQRIVDLIFGALATALPGKIPAASCGTMSSIALGGSNWTYYETVGGGSGAARHHRGAHAIQCHMTNTLNTPAEAIELQYPLRIRRFERAKGTGGGGKFSGGDGIVREIEALADCEGAILSDRRITHPFGLAGGSPAKSGENQIISTQIQTIPGKAKFALRAGERLRIQTPGGGGWGAI